MLEGPGRALGCPSACWGGPTSLGLRDLEGLFPLVGGNAFILGVPPQWCLWGKDSDPFFAPLGSL